MSANTIEEVVAMVPSDYRDVLRAPLHGVAKTVEKLCSARATLAKWEKQRASGTYPSFVAAKPPTLVLSKNFSSSDSAAAHQAAIANSHKEYMDLLLANAIKAKADDVQFLTAATDIKRIQNDILPLVEAQSSELTKTNILPVYKEVAGGEAGEVELLSWAPNPVVKALAIEMRMDIALFVFRVIFIIEQRHINLA